MESDLQHQHHFLHGHYPNQQHQQKQMNSGLTRYQSAPSTYFSSILDTDFCEDFLNRPSSPETESILARFLAYSGGNTDNNNISSHNLREVKQEFPVNDSVNSSSGMDNRLHQTHQPQQPQQQQQQQQQQQSNYSSPSQTLYHSQTKPPLPDHNSGSGKDYRVTSSKGMERLPQIKTGGGNNPNLVRHSSSPAGIFADISIEFENGYAVVRSVGDFGASKRDTSSAAAANRPPSGRMSPITEMGTKHLAENSHDQSGFGEGGSNNYVSGYSIGPWEDSPMMSADTKGLTDEDRTLSALDDSGTQNEGTVNPSPIPKLTHHLSLPNTSGEISAIEKFLQLQDSVPCKIRAKRGCATHPRSIAERVRRTRISERMRKLQDLVPNMDKQTNTSDMLDLAVDYIKDLQRQVKTLSENRAKCTCTSRQ